MSLALALFALLTAGTTRTLSARQGPPTAEAPSHAEFVEGRVLVKFRSNAEQQSIDDAVARKDWGWKEEYDLAAMTKDMLENLQA